MGPNLDITTPENGAKLNYQTQGDVCQLLMALHTRRETTPEALLAATGVDRRRRAYLITTLWHLVATERIGIDFTQPLTMQSRLWLII